MSTYKHRDWLYQKYIVEKLSALEISKMTNVRLEAIRRQLIKFNIPRRTLSEAQRSRQDGETRSTRVGGSKNPNWKGGINPTATRNRSRIKWEKQNKRKVPRGFHVHHIDGNCHNNKLSNLVLLWVGDHFRLHRARPQLIAHEEESNA